MRILVCLCMVLGLIGCSEQSVRVTEPEPDNCCCQVDSLKQIIEAQEFIIGQQQRMIRCLQQGNKPEDCYGGV